MQKIVGCVGKIVVERGGIAGARPVDSGGAQTTRVQFIVKGGNGNEFTFIALIINFDRQARPFAHENSIVENPMPGGLHPGNQGGMIRPGHGGIGHMQLRGRDPVLRQFPDSRNRCFWIPKQSRGKTINGDEHDMIVGCGLAWQFAAEQREQGEGQRDRF